MLYLLTIFLSLMVNQTAFAKQDKRILVVGDSLTEGYKVAKSQSWPSLVQVKMKASQKFQDYKVINAGSSGATSAYGISVIKFHLKRYKPELIVYALGANDGLRARPPKETKRDIEQAIKLAKEKNISFLLIGMRAPPNYGDTFPKNFSQTYTSLASKYKLPFMPFMLEGVAGNKNLNQADGIHPNSEGYKIIAKNIFPYITEALK